jgi:hypothetical protein
MSAVKDAPFANLPKLIGEWQTGIRTIHLAHTRAAADFALWEQILGVGVAIITAITGTAVFIAAATSQNAGVLFAVGGVTIAAAVVGAIHTQLQLPALATEHANAAHEYGVLRKEFEANLNCTPAEDICALLHATRGKWTGIEAKYRFVSDRRYWRAYKFVTKPAGEGSRSQEKAT